MDQVIDINYLRAARTNRPELGTLMQNSAHGDRFILTDTAILETMKNRQWELTARKSFEIISRFPNKIWIATEPSNLMNAELDSGRDATDVLDGSLTGGFRQFLMEIASGKDGPALSTIRKEILQAHIVLDTQQQDHQQNLATLRDARDAVKKTVNLKIYRGLPDEAQQRQFRLRYAKTLAQISTKDSASNEGKSKEVGDALASGHGVILRLQIGFFLLGFKWAVNNGLDSFPAEKATNEIMDLDHAVIATYFDGILTEELSVAEMRQDILDALQVQALLEI